ncbi:hypothetical protein [Robbsia sp. KACC 23696]|uniref:acetyl-CoA carboxylase biotin carboxyl carrier protein n=1 Tax=Robbsia sp. KACC 23696 TaxID=3149231 RepID=UPI00325B07C2
MEVKQLARLLAALEKTDIAELRWEEPDWAVSLTRFPFYPSRPDLGLPIPPDNGISAPSSSTALVKQDRRDRASLVKAEMPGRFIESHPATADMIDAAALRAGGIAVQKEALLGLLQIGVLMLPVSAPEEGVIDACLVTHGDAVEYGTSLFAMTGAPDGGV